MTRTAYNQARAMLRRLRSLVAMDAGASLITVYSGEPVIALEAAVAALNRTQFYSLTRSRPAMVRAVSHALRLLAREARKAKR